MTSALVEDVSYEELIQSSSSSEYLVGDSATAQTPQQDRNGGGEAGVRESGKRLELGVDGSTTVYSAIGTTTTASSSYANFPEEETQLQTQMQVQIPVKSTVAVENVNNSDNRSPRSLVDSTSQSDLDISDSAPSHSSENEFPDAGKKIRKRERAEQAQTGDGLGFLPESSGEASDSIERVRSIDLEEPSELKHFPIAPFASNRRWDPNHGLYPSSFDDSNHLSSLSGYGSVSSLDSGQFNNSANDFKSMIQDQNEHTDNDLSYLPPPSPPRISPPHSPGRLYDFNDASSSEQTPILSNYTKISYHNGDRDSLKPPSIQPMNENERRLHEEYQIPAIPTQKKPRLSPKRLRPEPLHRTRDRQVSVSEKLESYRGRKQPTSCRDHLFAIFYILQSCAITFFGLKFGPDALGLVTTGTEEDEFVRRNEGIHFTYANVLIIALTSGVITIIISACALGLMMKFTEQLIPTALQLAVILSFLWTFVGLFERPHNLIPATGLFIMGVTIAYAFTVWEEIPFVSANLFTALAVIRSTFAIVGLAFFTQILALIWIVIYFIAIIGIYDYFEENQIFGCRRLSVYIGLALSFTWTMQGMINVMQVCIAGYVHRWWFKHRLGQSERLDAIGESLVRATIYSFGSICFGSLFIGVVDFLRSIADHIRPNRDDTRIKVLVFVQEFVVSCIDYVSSIFHVFAMVYVGMYGYDFLEAGKQASNLIEKRGWHDIVAHHLLSHLLLIISLVIAGLSGIISMHVESGQHLPVVTGKNENAPMTSFCIGFVVALVLSNLLFSIITSARNAVIVCFAGSPVEFQRSHPECSRIMRRAWRSSWPGFVDFVEEENGMQRPPTSPGRLKIRSQGNLENLFI